MSSLNCLKIITSIIFTTTFYSSSTALALPCLESTFKMSTIAAEPAVLPFDSPPVTAQNPALSPDVIPLFPTPVSGSSPESAMPIIPSSPSPPDPDSMSNPQFPTPGLGIAPRGAIPESSAFGPSLSCSFSSVMMVLVWFGFGEFD
ncbi:hypothetical protein RND81_05G197000 [Saponaria officinalis]|uniref:Uncharacterized protein n=1 Tax=Saponaria officinalis TaxID=3572 RepID=A0AAW1L039_SAPOF